MEQGPKSPARQAAEMRYRNQSFGPGPENFGAQPNANRRQPVYKGEHAMGGGVYYKGRPVPGYLKKGERRA